MPSDNLDPTFEQIDVAEERPQLGSMNFDGTGDTPVVHGAGFAVSSAVFDERSNQMIGMIGVQSPTKLAGLFATFTADELRTVARSCQNAADFIDQYNNKKGN